MVRVYCSNACRQRAYRQRARGGGSPTVKATPDLPVALDSFVGRKAELHTITRLLKHNRLVTVFGPGGAGKTRMALQAVNDLRQAFPGGVYLTEIGPLTTPEQVSQATAEALSVVEMSTASIVDAIAQELGDRKVLLLLDNCEHLVGACGELAVTLLHRCPQLHILATSRETLRRPGEMVVPAGELTAADAMQLFADRAVAAEPAFALTRENRRLVRSLCTRLDNLPLAIELAARLVRLFPLEDILARLENRFELLASDIRGGHARHRSLYAAIDWSHDLLSPDEQALFRRLAVLPGGFDVEFAAAVSRDLDLPVIELIASLESKSLVTPVARAAGRARFRQLESVRAYARQQLAQSDEGDVAVDQLADALVALASRLLDRFLTDADTLAAFCRERDNLYAAMEYLRDRCDPRALLLATALVRCRQLRGIVLAEGLELLAAVLRIPDAPREYRILALEQSAWLAGWRGDHEEALGFARQADRLAAEHGDTTLRCRSLNVLAFACQIVGDMTTAVATFTECLRLVRGNGDPADVALCMHNVAWAKIVVGDLDAAAALIDEVVPVYRERGEAARMGAVMHSAGVLRLRRGDTGGAEASFMAGLRELGEQRSRICAYLLEGLAITAITDGRNERGLRLGAAGAQQRTVGTSGETWWDDQVASAMATARARLGPAHAEAAMEQGRQLTMPTLLSYAFTGRRDGGNPAAPSPLSKREREVAVLVVQGSTNLEIAARLNISERTVVSHLEHVRTKLDLRTRAQVAAWAARNLVTA